MNIPNPFAGADITRAFLELLETGVTIYQGQSVKLKPRDSVMNLFSCVHGDGKFCLTSVWLTDSAWWVSAGFASSGRCEAQPGGCALWFSQPLLQCLSFSLQGRSRNGIFEDRSGPGDVRCELLYNPGVWKPEFPMYMDTEWGSIDCC